MGPAPAASGRPTPRLLVYSARFSHFSKEDRRSQVPPGAHSAVSVSTCVSPLTVQALCRLAFKRSPVPPDARNVDPPGPFSGAASGSRAAGTFRRRTFSVAESQRSDCLSLRFPTCHKPLVVQDLEDTYFRRLRDLMASQRSGLKATDLSGPRFRRQGGLAGSVLLQPPGVWSWGAFLLN